MTKILPAFILFQIIAIAAFGQPYQIGSRTFNLQDPNRSNRSVPTEVFYPAATAGQSVPVAAGTFPVIIFAHGFSMDYDAYENFWQELVPQGYIMAFPRTETSTLPPPDHLALAEDLVFLRQQFQDWGQNSATLFYRKLNDRYAYSGHSMGGGCSFIATSLDPGVTALVNFAAAETNPSAIQEAGQISDVPALIFAGQRDCVTPTSSNQTPMYDSLKSACKFYVEVKDGMHCRFADPNTLCDLGELTCQPIPSISRTDQHERTFRVLSPWLNFMLKSDCNIWSDFIQNLSADTTVSFRSDCDYEPLEPQIFNATDTMFCEDDSVKLYLGIQADSIIWSNGQANRDTIWVKIEDIHVANTIDQFGCQAESNPIRTIEKPKPRPLISASDTFLCPDEKAILSLDSVYDAYFWSNSTTDSVLIISDSGIYSVRVEAANGCFGRSDTVKVNLASEYPRPLITKNGDTLSLRSGNGVQWFRNGDSIPGAESGVYIVDSFGDYYAIILEESGCLSKSDTVSIVFNSVNTVSELVEKIYPNPFKERLVLAVEGPSLLSITDLSGRVIWQGVTEGGAIELKTRDWLPGMYLLQVRQKESGETMGLPILKY